VALPFLAVCVFFVAILTMVTSPGPIFFRQERVGYRGRRFKLYKFRTMHTSADVAPHQLHFAQLVNSNVPMRKLDAKGDTRLIFGGWLMRASGIDELPQIINVVRGEMSIVGPRPCIPYEYAQYSPTQKQRFDSVPGLTGLWQVSGKNRTTFEEMVRLDIQYSKTCTPALDARIMLLTVPTLVWQIVETWRAKREAAPASSAPVATIANPTVRSAPMTSLSVDTQS
jgi:lipopolysaccharide/colanic/teichoic acid biosynthesis glycosyltransferase